MDEMDHSNAVKLVMAEALVARAEQIADGYVTRRACMAAAEEDPSDLASPMFASMGDTTGMREEAEEMLAAAASFGLDVAVPTWDSILERAEWGAKTPDEKARDGMY